MRFKLHRFHGIVIDNGVTKLVTVKILAVVVITNVEELSKLDATIYHRFADQFYGATAFFFSFRSSAPLSGEALNKPQQNKVFRYSFTSFLWWFQFLAWWNIRAPTAWEQKKKKKKRTKQSDNKICVQNSDIYSIGHYQLYYHLLQILAIFWYFVCDWCFKHICYSRIKLQIFLLCKWCYSETECWRTLETTWNNS